MKIFKKIICCFICALICGAGLAESSELTYFQAPITAATKVTIEQLNSSSSLDRALVTVALCLDFENSLPYSYVVLDMASNTYLGWPDEGSSLMVYVHGLPKVQCDYMIFYNCDTSIGAYMTLDPALDSVVEEALQMTDSIDYAYKNNVSDVGTVIHMLNEELSNK